MQIAIIGGGIGGLCTAYALQKKGFNVHIYEASSSLKPLGAGIGIGSNAMQALVKMGLGEEIYKNGTVLNTQFFLDEQGRILNRVDFSALEKLYGQHNITIQRANLHETLYHSITPSTLFLNKRCLKVVDEKEHCTLYFADGTTANYDYIIAADGIKSNIRQQYVRHSAPRYAGYTCWRGIVDKNSAVKTDTSIEIFHAAGRFGYAPLKNGQVYWFACVNTAANNADFARFTKEQLADYFEGFPQPVQKLILQTAREHFLHHDLYDVKPLKKFHFNRVLLLGDAAHATTPNMGQGAGQAIEDAIVFSEALVATQDFQSAAALYERARLKKTTKVIRLSRLIGQAAQWSNPLLVRGRNFIFPFIPSALLLYRLKFLYK